MKNKALCIIDGVNTSQSLHTLLAQRCIAALPYGGRYRLIDFPLSNVVHSGITNVAIFPDGDYHSLSDHIRSGKFWGLDRKVDGLFLLPPKKEIVSSANSLTFARMREHIDYFLRSRQKYVIIYQANVITNIPFEKLVKHHIESKADVTIVSYKNKQVGIFVIEKDYLIDLILRHEISPYNSISALIELHEGLKINTYMHDSYTRTIDSIVSYYRANMDMLKYKYGFELFLLDRPIITKTKDESPAFYSKTADVSNSVVANGCIIEGKVENSIIFRDVIIKKGAIVRNSILMPNTVVGENSIVDRMISDKHVLINDGATVKGQEFIPAVLSKGQRVAGAKEINILQVATECVPFYKTGGLANVIFELTEELIKQGVRTDVILPYYSILDQRYVENLVHDFQSTVTVGENEINYDVYHYSNAGVKYYFISSGDLSRERPYGYSDDCKRYELFCYLTLDFISKRLLKYDVIHCHDWLTGLIPYFMKYEFSQQTRHFNYTKTIMTIHNIQYQGICDISDLAIIPQNEMIPNEIMLYEKVNFLKAGIVLSDRVTTVSPTYCNEICYPYFAEGLDRFIYTRKDALHGILNGVSYSYNNPNSDLSIYKTYCLKTVHLKKENKCQMQAELGLPVNPDIPVIGMVTRVIEQKGFDLILEIFEDLMRENVQFVLLGDGDHRYTSFFKKMANQYPDKVSANIGYNAYNSQMIYAGSDMFLMPSRFEPCGISQMIAMKYGTIPIVRETGGLKDTVIPYNEFTLFGNGFSFAHYSSRDMFYILKRALHFYYQPLHWNKLIQSAMETDLSWESSAKEYINLYRKVMND
ncbi:MAG TPA: glucose-1-phosphate adenylyltransferase [Firmicutes bacterium]|nr:glucose-1-phosphate adenylyltransferase [Bacillota bacterium]